MKIIKTVNLKSIFTREKTIFSYFFNFVSVTKLIMALFPDVGEPNHCGKLT